MAHLRGDFDEKKQDVLSSQLIGLLDVDGTLIQGPTQSYIADKKLKCDIPSGSINWNLIKAIKNSHWKNADFYLFTNMIFYPEQDVAERHALVQILKANGLKVLGVITPADCVYHLEQNDVYRSHLACFNQFLTNDNFFKNFKMADDFSKSDFISAIKNHKSYQALVEVLSCQSNPANLGIAFRHVSEMKDPHHQSVCAKNFLEVYSLINGLPHLKGMMFKFFLEHKQPIKTHCLVVDDKREVLESIRIVNLNISSLTLLKNIITNSIIHDVNKTELEYLEALSISFDKTISHGILSRIISKKNVTGLVDPDFYFRLPETKDTSDLGSVLKNFDIHEQARILQKVVQSIPNTLMDNQQKFLLCKNVDPLLVEVDDPLLGDSSYHETIVELPKVKIKKPITIQEFNTISHSICLDDLLLLSISYIENDAKLDIDKNVVRNWMYAYAMGEHEKLKQQIQQFCLTHPNSNPFLSDLSDQLSKSKLPKPDQVSVRRFFETRLAHQFCTTKITSNIIHSINKISKYILNRTVTTPAELQDAIFDFGEIKDKLILNRCRELQSLSFNHAKKGRYIKSHFKNKWLELKGEKGDKVESKHFGILKSVTPTFFDYRSRFNLTNKVVDIYNPGNNENDYPQRFPFSPFVCSLSGHSFFVFAILEKYIEAHADDAEVSNDINNFILSLINFYVMRGYHSILEIMHVFMEKSVLDTFAKFNLNVNPALIFEDVTLLIETINESAFYAKTLALKSMVNAELVHRHGLHL